MFRLLATMLLVSGCSIQATAQSRIAVEGVADQPQIDLFLNELKAAVERDDRARVASLIQYPITVAIAGLRVPISNSATLIQQYDAIFTADMRDAIAHGDPTALDVKVVGGGLNVSALRAPHHENGFDADDSRPERATRPTTAHREPARRLIVRGVGRPTQFSGNLAAGIPDVYVVGISKGQLLEVRLERAGRGAIVRVTDAKTGAPLNARLPNGAPSVVGRAETAGDYRIEVHHTATSDAAALPYILSVSVR